MIDGMAQQTLAPPPGRSRRGRGVTFWVGLALLVAGLALLGYVGWQLFGTNVVAHQKQQQLVQQTERAWRGDAGASGSAKGVELHGAEALIRIPRFGRDYVMPVQDGVSDRVLAEGFGHFRGSAQPGRVGNFALAAHRVTHGEPLRNMPDLRPGDRVVVQTKDADYTYRLDTDPNDLVVGFHDVWVVDPLPKNPRGGPEPAQRPGQKLITLTTCAELFHTDNRMIAFGHLVNTTRHAG
ncbi:MAG: class E sortase [Nocardioidaceae bacterium]|nr:class E sortase [Nocardioidaceae bacterium]NUS52488.1 class E sortase [Nocardioidaceae bacterium]